jgi:hypothetical protein
MVAGAFLIYCGHTALNPDGSGRDGFVKGAAGDTCCGATAPVFTTLFDGNVVGLAATSAIAVGAYRQVVVYNVPTHATELPTCSDIYAHFRPDASHPFGYTGQRLSANTPTLSGGTLRVDGSDLILLNWGADACHILVAGVQ